MDITQHRNYLFVKSLPEEEEEEAACSQEFYQLEMKSSQSPSVSAANEQQYWGTFKHTDTSSPVASCMAAERGLCARLPPSFGHYTALNIVGKDPTDQSTSWMSTTDEPSDHEPMSASPVHVWSLAPSKNPFNSFPCLGPGRAQVLFKKTLIPL